MSVIDHEKSRRFKKYIHVSLACYSFVFTILFLPTPRGPPFSLSFFLSFFFSFFSFFLFFISFFFSFFLFFSFFFPSFLFVSFYVFSFFFTFSLFFFSPSLFLSYLLCLFFYLFYFLRFHFLLVVVLFSSSLLSVLFPSVLSGFFHFFYKMVNFWFPFLCSSIWSSIIWSPFSCYLNWLRKKRNAVWRSSFPRPGTMVLSVLIRFKYWRSSSIRFRVWFRTTECRDVINGPLARPFTHTAHSFWSFPYYKLQRALLALLARSAALICWFAHSLPGLWESEWLDVLTSSCSEP